MSELYYSRLSQEAPHSLASMGGLDAVPAIQPRVAKKPQLTWKLLGSGSTAQVGLANILAEAGNLLLTLSMAATAREVKTRFLIRTGGPALATGFAASVAQRLAIRFLPA